MMLREELLNKAETLVGSNSDALYDAVDPTDVALLATRELKKMSKKELLAFVKKHGGEEE
jgi:hypothetical protein